MVFVTFFISPSWDFLFLVSMLSEWGKDEDLPGRGKVVERRQKGSRGGREGWRWGLSVLTGGGDEGVGMVWWMCCREVDAQGWSRREFVLEAWVVRGFYMTRGCVYYKLSGLVWRMVVLAYYIL